RTPHAVARGRRRTRHRNPGRRATRVRRYRRRRGRAAPSVAGRRVLPPHRPRRRGRHRRRRRSGMSGMTTALDTDAIAFAAQRTPAEDRPSGWCHDAIVLTRRNLVHVRREPAQLSDVTVQPILFTLLFTQLFGAAMVLPGGGSYVDFAIAG